MTKVSVKTQNTHFCHWLNLSKFTRFLGGPNAEGEPMRSLRTGGLVSTFKIIFYMRALILWWQKHIIPWSTFLGPVWLKPVWPFRVLLEVIAACQNTLGIYHVVVQLQTSEINICNNNINFICKTCCWTSGVPPSPCFPIFLARTTFVLESLPEAKNPGQDAFLGDFVFNSSYSRDNSLLD